MFKIISWLLASVIIITMAIAYICPMTVRGTMGMNSAPSLCHGEFSIASAMDMPGCAGVHGAIVAVLTNAIPQITNLLLAFVLLVIVHSFFSKNFLATFLQSKFFHWRRLCLDYCTTIKALVEERILSYLNFLGNYTVASLT